MDGWGVLYTHTYILRSRQLRQTPKRKSPERWSGLDDVIRRARDLADDETSVRCLSLSRRLQKAGVAAAAVDAAAAAHRQQLSESLIAH